MLNPHFLDRTYSAEVVRIKPNSLNIFASIVKLAIKPKTESYTIERYLGDGEAPVVKICHAFLTSHREFHRFTKTVTLMDGSEIQVPEKITLRGKDHYLYDVIIAQSGKNIIVAVPYHGLAEEFFVKMDEALSGASALYERLDITQMVLKLGANGVVTILNASSKRKVALSVTRCHLMYADQRNRSSNLQQIRMTGGNLGASKEYKSLIEAVLEPGSSVLKVTPTILGFALLVDGVSKSSATTDRHGNFKLWIAPGLRRLMRLFPLLEALDTIDSVISTTNNVPIMQSGSIRDAED